MNCSQEEGNNTNHVGTPAASTPDRVKETMEKKTPVQIILDQVDKLRGRSRVMKKYCSRERAAKEVREASKLFEESNAGISAS